VAVLYDSETLYVGVRAVDREPERITARILTRDRIIRSGLDNLTRFDLFLPERREFFLENAGIFEFGVRGFFGPPPFLMFFSRRIGISEDDGGGLERLEIGPVHPRVPREGTRGRAWPVGQSQFVTRGEPLRRAL
jgi:hypothetical protein